MKSIFSTKTPFERFGLMIDNSRTAVMTVKAVKRMIDVMEMLDYNMLMLYTEDTYEVEHQPYFGHLRGRFSKEELKEIDRYAKAHEVELVPCIQTLGHLHCLMYWQEYAEIADVQEILCVGEDKVYSLIEDMFSTLAECFTSRIANIGMDEAFLTGLGKYLEKHGYRNRFEILKEHLEHVVEIARRYGFTVCMWSDMFFRLATGGYSDSDYKNVDLSVRGMIPEDVQLIYWDYYGKDKKHYDTWIEAHQKLTDNCMFAGGLWSWTGFAPHNAFAIHAGKMATESCIEHEIRDVFYTVWGDNGAECSKFAILPALFHNSCIAHGIADETEIKKKFQECFGIAFDDYMLLDLPGTANCDAGCPNPDKYMLYCDCLLGKFDLNVKQGEGQNYACVAKRLEDLSDCPEYGILFETMAALCRVLEIKFELGVRTREAYLSGEKNRVELIITDYDELLFRLEIFYETFRRQWLSENKPHGLDVHETRIGGLQQRVKGCKRRLKEYLDGEVKQIEELEEPVLDFQCRGESIGEDEKQAFYAFGWGMHVTASII